MPDLFSASASAGPLNTTHHAQTFTTPAHVGPPPQLPNLSSIGHALGPTATGPTVLDNFSQAGTPASAFGQLELLNDEASTPTKHLPPHGDTHNRLPAPETGWSHITARRGWAHFDQLTQGNDTWNVHDYSHHLLRMGLHLDYLTNGLQVRGNENGDTDTPAFEIVTDNISTNKLAVLMDWLEATAEYVRHLVELRTDFQPRPPPINNGIDNNLDYNNNNNNMQEDQQWIDEYGIPVPQPSTNESDIFLKQVLNIMSEMCQEMKASIQAINDKVEKATNLTAPALKPRLPKSPIAPTNPASPSFTPHGPANVENKSKDIPDTDRRKLESLKASLDNPQLGTWDRDT
ncbi:hypothetical protein H0H81_003583 [Sphagnurus paluster]|uniref:Uncharacterized protein n=1 Tax=Sphagnurus paluster TaxID=117069 RepID=A0A9P7FRH5_9AGAR|nr:hypothetical protein H0H81_003583 [Sphagnurus paluster]